MIYFILETETDNPKVKIGRATNLQSRLGQLQTGNPNPLAIILSLKVLKTTVSESEVETWLHHKFSKDRIRNNAEWFRYSDEIKQFVECFPSGLGCVWHMSAHDFGINFKLSH